MPVTLAPDALPVQARAHEPWRWAVPLLVAAAIWLLPHGGFQPRGWALLCLLAATVSGLITHPLPSGAVVLIAITAGAAFRVFTIDAALSGFANSTVWMIVAAFLFARGLVQTRLGERIAYNVISRLGGSPLRLGYSVVLANLAIAPMTPSNTARAGGILFPITLNVARAFDSEPGPTASRMGAYLMQTLYQGDLIASAMFLTATAPNPLVASFAQQASSVVLSWTMWAVSASVPGLVALLVIPYAVYRLCPPTARDTHVAQALASERLRAMGPMSREERVMLAVFTLVLALWLSGEWHGLSAATVGFLGLAVLLLTRVLAWQDVLNESRAWDALVWFGGLMMLSSELNKAGFPSAFAAASARFVHGWPWWWALAGLVVIYLYSHYAFASLIAHVTAMFPAFFAMAIALGAPPLVAALALGFFSSLNATITHYGTGPAPIIFGAGYLTQPQWWRIGFVISLVHLAIWLPIGLLWWRMLGLW